jgi:hypothetical protein
VRLGLDSGTVDPPPASRRHPQEPRQTADGRQSRIHSRNKFFQIIDVSVRHHFIMNNTTRGLLSIRNLVRGALTEIICISTMYILHISSNARRQLLGMKTRVVFTTSICLSKYTGRSCISGPVLATFLFQGQNGARLSYVRVLRGLLRGQLS